MAHRNSWFAHWKWWFSSSLCKRLPGGVSHIFSHFSHFSRFSHFSFRSPEIDTMDFARLALERAKKSSLWDVHPGGRNPPRSLAESASFQKVVLKSQKKSHGCAKVLDLSTTSRSSCWFCLRSGNLIEPVYRTENDWPIGRYNQNLVINKSIKSWPILIHSGVINTACRKIPPAIVRWFSQLETFIYFRVSQRHGMFEDSRDYHTMISAMIPLKYTKVNP